MLRSRLFFALVAVVSSTLLILALHDHLGHSTAILYTGNPAEPKSFEQYHILKGTASSAHVITETVVSYVATQSLHRQTRHRFVPFAAKNCT